MRRQLGTQEYAARGNANHMSLDVLLLACLCGAAARGAPTSPRCLPETELEETIDRDADDESARIKGFKPGTNAQRHRLYRIQHSRRASSRLADLTSMVRDSFRRVNVVSESSGDEKEPAAARPAARPQLSWRASAPEYGTFES